MTNSKTDRQKLIEIQSELEVIVRDTKAFDLWGHPPGGLLRSEFLRSLEQVIRSIDNHNAEETVSTGSSARPSQVGAPDERN